MSKTSSKQDASAELGQNEGISLTTIAFEKEGPPAKNLSCRRPIFKTVNSPSSAKLNQGRQIFALLRVSTSVPFLRCNNWYSQRCLSAYVLLRLRIVSLSSILSINSVKPMSALLYLGNPDHATVDVFCLIKPRAASSPFFVADTGNEIAAKNTCTTARSKK